MEQIMVEANSPTFREVQQIRQWWLWLMLIAVVLVVAFFYFTKMTTEVVDGATRIRFFPAARSIRLADVESYEVRTYSPIREYGGWGIKGWSRENMAYNVRGNRGVELTLRDGRRVLLGSQRPDELAGAIEALLPKPVRQAAS